MIVVRLFVKIFVFVIEKIVSELAILAALLSVTEQGPYPARILGGMKNVAMAIYSFGHAYVKNTGFRDFIAGLSSSVLKSIASMADNIQADPQKVLVALVATFIFYKIVALLLMLIRKKAIKVRHSDKPTENTDPGTPGRTYERIYDERRN